MTAALAKATPVTPPETRQLNTIKPRTVMQRRVKVNHERVDPKAVKENPASSISEPPSWSKMAQLVLGKEAPDGVRIS